MGWLASVRGLLAPKEPLGQGQRSAAVFVELWRSNREPADDELVEMAIGPPKGRLQHFMELSEVELHRQFQTAADSRLDTDDMDIGADDAEIGVEGAEHSCGACRV